MAELNCPGDSVLATTLTTPHRVNISVTSSHHQWHHMILTDQIEAMGVKNSPEADNMKENKKGKNDRF